MKARTHSGAWHCAGPPFRWSRPAVAATAHPPSPRYMHAACAAAGGTMAVFGGCGLEGGYCAAEIRLLHASPVDTQRRALEATLEAVSSRLAAATVDAAEDAGAAREGRGAEAAAGGGTEEEAAAAIAEAREAFHRALRGLRVPPPRLLEPQADADQPGGSVRPGGAHAASQRAPPAGVVRVHVPWTVGATVPRAGEEAVSGQARPRCDLTLSGSRAHPMPYPAQARCSSPTHRYARSSDAPARRWAQSLYPSRHGPTNSPAGHAHTTGAGAAASPPSLPEGWRRSATAGGASARWGGSRGPSPGPRGTARQWREWQRTQGDAFSARRRGRPVSMQGGAYPLRHPLGTPRGGPSRDYLRQQAAARAVAAGVRPASAMPRAAGGGAAVGAAPRRRPVSAAGPGMQGGRGSASSGSLLPRSLGGVRGAGGMDGVARSPSMRSLGGNGPSRGEVGGSARPQSAFLPRPRER